jgi:hypothetical protein
MAKYEAKLLTPSLLNSWKWLENCPPTWSEKAYEDLDNYLNRRPIDKKVFEKGNRFENQVQSVCRGIKISNKMPTVNEVAKIVKGGKWQQVTKCQIVLPEITFMLYGRKDIDFPDMTIDIKTTGNYKNPDYYIDSYQHKIYLYSDLINGHPKKMFKYVISDFESVYEIDIDMPKPEILKKEVFEIVQRFWNFLKSKESLQKAYLSKFCR